MYISQPFFKNKKCRIFTMEKAAPKILATSEIKKDVQSKPIKGPLVGEN
jgi:hypothetical protein